MVSQNLARNTLSKVTLSEAVGKKSNARPALEVDEARGNGLAGRIHQFGCGAPCEVSDCDNPIALDAEVNAARFDACSIEDRTTRDEKIELGRLSAGAARDGEDDETAQSCVHSHIPQKYRSERLL